MDSLLLDMDNLPLEHLLLLDMLNLLIKSKVHHLHLLLLLGDQEGRLDQRDLPVLRVRRGQGPGTDQEIPGAGTGQEIQAPGMVQEIQGAGAGQEDPGQGMDQ